MRAWSSAILVGALVLATSPAAANQPDWPDPAAEQARDLINRASKHYHLGEYREALADYREAYWLKEDLFRTSPLFFYIGHCHRLLGEHADAARAYRAFLSARPWNPDRADVEALIAGEDRAVEE